MICFFGGACRGTAWGGTITALPDPALVPCRRAPGAPQQLNAGSASVSTALRPCPGSIRAGPTHPNVIWMLRVSPCPGTGIPALSRCCGVAGAGPEPPVGLSHIGRLLRFLPAAVSLFFFFFFPRSPVFPLQPAHCAAGWSSWVECFRLKYNFSAFKSLRSSLPPLPPRRPAPPTRDNLMDYSVGLRGSP